MTIFDKRKLNLLEPPDASDSARHAILVVDDEDANLRVMSSILNPFYRLITATDGQQALEIVERMADSSSLACMICDQRMPRLAGLELIQKVNKLLPSVVCIIVTAFIDLDAIVGSINKAEIYQFIIKPFDSNDFVLTVKRAVETFELKQTLDAYHRNLEDIVLARTQELANKNAELELAYRSLEEASLAKVELEHLKMQNVLIHTAKLVALGKWSSGLTHEISHPVGAISMLVDSVSALLKQGRAADAAEVMPKITREITRLSNLILRLRSFSRLDSPRLGVLDLKQLLDDARQMFSPRLFADNIGYHESIDALTVYADPDRLCLVIVNIVLNAAEAMANSEQKNVVVTAHMVSGHVRLSFRDTGPGIRPEAMSRILEPFYTTKEDGLGLGLALSAESLYSMNGRIEVANHVNGGAEFTIILPSSPTSEMSHPAMDPGKP
jgi:C4-dicarboxylate-specific signal transduction histidine kinase